MGLVPNPHCIRNQDKVTQVSLMLKLSYTKSGFMVLKIDFLVCPTRMNGQGKTLHRPISDLG